MADPLILTPDDPRIAKFKFTPYRSAVERLVAQFLPPPDQPQFTNIKTPWGEVLKTGCGDYLVGEIDKPDDVWPVAEEIFKETYMITRPGYCTKKALTYLAPLTALTNGNPDQMVSVHTLEGVVTVRAGDFYLAKGVKGEIWPFPKEKVEQNLVSVE